MAGFQVIFLIALALVWIIFAVVQDLRKREIANWLNFSLIIFAIGFRFFYSLFSNSGFGFFFQGLIGLGIFFALANIFYYGRMFAAGDAKLLFALGGILPFSDKLSINLDIFILFFILFLFAGAAYGIFTSSLIIFSNFRKFKKEFLRRAGESKSLLVLLLFLAALIAIFGIFSVFLFYLSLLAFVIPYLYLTAKSIDECCMVKKIPSGNLREGDWLYRDVKIGEAIIKKRWSGLSGREIAMLKKNKKYVLIKQGVAFSPAFLIAFLALIYFWFVGIPKLAWL